MHPACVFTIFAARARLGGWLLAAWLLTGGFVAEAAGETAPDLEPIRRASAAYVEAFNNRDFKALADQWTARAELVEGGSRFVGREAIVGSIRGWLQRHPEAKLQIRLDGVQLVAAPLARVTGTMQFTRKPGEKPVESRFESLRVLEDGGWRLAESLVAPSHAAALDDLGWLIGRWQATDAASGASVEATFERAVGGYAILGRTTLRPKAGDAIETIEVIHADREAVAVRSWLFDSTGARAEGFFESDGTTFNRRLAGTPADSASGRRAEWVQTIAPTGEGRFTMQSIERTLDGRPLPDGMPLHFQKIR